MPDGHTHAIATLTVAGLVAPLALLDWRALPLAAGALTGLVVDPDLDHDGWTLAERRVWRWWKPAGAVWRLFWYPYALTHKHRGSSHWPILGTLVRIAYLLALPLAGALWQGWPVPWGIVGLWCAGLCLADLVHIIMDRAF